MLSDDEIRELRRCFSQYSEEWATCTKALHAADLGDREMYRWRCAQIRNRLEASRADAAQVEARKK